MSGIGSAEDELRAWLAAWGRHVADVDFEAAAAMFADTVIGFGTRAGVAIGLDELRTEQWGHVWPAITAFAFDVDRASTVVSDDGSLGAIWTTWSSEGRRGRATIVLRHDSATDAWVGVHTHFSLDPALG